MMGELVSCFRFLAKHAYRFNHHPIFNRIVERKEYIVERDLLLSAFIVRTLFEAGKLSDEMADYELSIVSYPATSRNTNKLMPLLRRVPDDDLYDYGRPSQLSIPGRRFVNQLIHALLFRVLISGTIPDPLLSWWSRIDSLRNVYIDAN